MVDTQLWDAMEKMLRPSSQVIEQIKGILAPKKKRKKRRSYGCMRTYFNDETPQVRLSRIESETQQRLNDDQKKRTTTRHIDYGRRIRSKAHRCPMIAETRKRW